MNWHIVVLLISRRLFVFLDEWLTYIIFWHLYDDEEYLVMLLAAPFAVYFNYRGYAGLWQMRRENNLPE